MGISKKAVGLLMGGALVGGAVYLLSRYRKPAQDSYTDILDKLFNQVDWGDMTCDKCGGCCFGHCGAEADHNMPSENATNNMNTEAPEQPKMTVEHAAEEIVKQNTEQADKGIEHTDETVEQTTTNTKQGAKGMERTHEEVVNERIDRFIDIVQEVLNGIKAEGK